MDLCTHTCSIQNWVEDLFWKQLDLNYPDMPDAMVYEIEETNPFSLLLSSSLVEPVEQHSYSYF